MTEIAERLVNVHGLAERLGLPASWLEQEAERGRIPVLRVGRHLRFDVRAVEATLIERARQQPEGAIMR